MVAIVIVVEEAGRVGRVFVHFATGAHKEEDQRQQSYPIVSAKPYITIRETYHRSATQRYGNDSGEHASILLYNKARSVVLYLVHNTCICI